MVASRWFFPVGALGGEEYPPRGWARTNWLGARYTLRTNKGDFEQYHTGDDLNKSGDSDIGEPVRAVAAGQVVFAGNAPGTWGGVIVIRHEEGASFVVSRAAHLAGITVRAGERVAAGQTIAIVGPTAGIAPFEPHLHFDLTGIGDDWLLNHQPGNYPNGKARGGPLDWPGTDLATLRAHYISPGAFLRARISPISIPQPAGEWLVVAAERGANVRAAPAGATILDTLPLGTRVRVSGHESKSLNGRLYMWGQITEGGGVGGYIARELLAAVGPRPARSIKGINIDLRNPSARPAPAQLLPFSYARFAYDVSDDRGSTDLVAAHAHHGPYIQQCIEAGITPVLVCSHETSGEGAGYDWEQMDAAAWKRLAKDHAAMCARVANLYGEAAIYQIWNEGDLPPGTRTSVAIPPADYAHLLDEAVRAIRLVIPKARIISQGHAAGDPRYWLAVRKASQTAETLSGLGLHAYTITGATLARTLTPWLAATNMPLWITEFGPQRPDWDDASAARYLGEWFKAADAQPRVAAALYYAYGPQDGNTPMIDARGGRRMKMWEAIG